MAKEANLIVVRNYGDRKLLDLRELIEKRAAKVDELIKNEPNLPNEKGGDALIKAYARIDEYSSIVDYLRFLEAIIDGNEEAAELV